MMQFIQKIHGQPPPTCRSKPPMVGPVIRPTAIAEANKPRAWPRRLAPKLAARIAVDIGKAIARPTAITARANKSSRNEAEMPPNPAPAA
jgi:hypothetical protein